MTDLSAGLHYVTNAPLELHSLVIDFLETVRLPISHLVLKHYPSGARSLLSSWLEPAGERKRANVVKILDDFRSSQFLLIGDSGELDLELYCALAAERPEQVRGVFIRDVSSPAASKAQASAFSVASSSDKLASASSNTADVLPQAPRTALKQQPRHIAQKLENRLLRHVLSTKRSYRFRPASQPLRRPGYRHC